MRRNLARINIIDAFEDPNLFGRFVRDQSTWASWKVFLKSFFGLPMDESELEVYRKHTSRTEPPRGQAREVWVVSGRRSGKSYISSLLSAYVSIFKDHSNVLRPGETGYILIIAPTRKQAGIIKQYLEAFFIDNSMFSSLLDKISGDEIKLKNNIAITILSTDFKSIRGFTAIAVVLDEICFYQSEGQKPDFEVIRAIRPTLATTGGPIIAISSPYSRSGVLYDVYRDHFGQDNDEVLVWQAASRDMNPTLDQSLIDREDEKDPEGSRAEWHGEFRTDITSFLDLGRIEACIHPYTEHPPRQDVLYQAFTDTSGGRRDTYVTCVGHHDRGRVIIDALRARRPPFDPIKTAAEHAEFVKSYRISKVTGDFYAAEYTTRAWQENGIEYEQSGKRASDIYLHFESLVNTQGIEMPNIEELRKELVNLERRVSRAGTGQDVVTHPRNAHDDHANAVAGCAWLLSRERPCCVRRKIEDSKGRLRLYRYDIPNVGKHIYWTCRKSSCGDYVGVLYDESDRENHMRENYFGSLEDFERHIRDLYCIDIELPNCEILHGYLMY